MPKYLRYNISIVYLDSDKPGRRKHLYERVIFSTDNLSIARDKFVDLTLTVNRDFKCNSEDYKYEIDDMAVDFARGDEDVWYRISFPEIFDYYEGQLYIGPGAYILKGSLLQ